MKKTIKRISIISLFTVLLSTALIADKMIVDQLGNKVTIPSKIERSVVLMHHALDISIQLGAKEQIVGVLEKWTKYLPDAVNSFPDIKTMATPGDLKSVNIEALLALKPDIVILTHYAPEAMKKQIENAGVPVIKLSLYKASLEEAQVLNPTLKNPDKAYTQGLFDAINILAKVYGKEQRAKDLIDTIKKNRELVSKHLGNIPSDKKISTYMANPNLHTYGTGKYTSVIMEKAGGVNVAAALNGYKAVGMEDILKWNPSVLFVQNRFSKIIPEIKASALWNNVDAVKNNKIYITPEYAKPWGHPTPESIALGEVWMAKKLYPSKFEDINMQTLANDYYNKFYNINYNGKH